MEEKLTLIIQTGFVLFVLGLIICVVGLAILIGIQYCNYKLERQSMKAEQDYENDPRTQLRRQKEEEAFNSLYFDRIQEFRNGI